MIHLPFPQQGCTLKKCVLQQAHLQDIPHASKGGQAAVGSNSCRPRASALQVSYASRHHLKWLIRIDISGLMYCYWSFVWKTLLDERPKPHDCKIRKIRGFQNTVDFTDFEKPDFPDLKKTTDFEKL